ncbi:MAG: efflux RND transporter periplasmic adaptor subunit, partial [Sphingomonadales bacterium]
FAPTLREGKKIDFYTADRKEKMQAGIYALDPSIDNATRSLRARAVCPNPKGKLLPGSFVTVTFNAINESTSLAVPTQAIVPILKGQKLFLIKNGTAVEQKVETGFRNDTLVTVIQGIKPGDTVAVNGVVQLKKDSKVIVKRILNASATTNKP